MRGQIASLTRLQPVGIHLGGTQAWRQLVEYRVDILVAIGTAELLGQFNAFVEDDAPRDIQAMLELKSANPENAVLDRLNFVELAIEQRHDQRIEFCHFLAATVQQQGKVHCVRF